MSTPFTVLAFGAAGAVIIYLAFRIAISAHSLGWRALRETWPEVLLLISILHLALWYLAMLNGGVMSSGERRLHENPVRYGRTSVAIAAST